jgi:signal transduction histidine kinase
VGLLRGLLAAIFVALLAPTAVLVYQAYGQLKWEAFHLNRLSADEFTLTLEQRVVEVFGLEEARSVSDYDFLVVTGGEDANFVQRSTLSKLSEASRLPGLIAHFQVDADGRLSTPLLPGEGDNLSAFGITPEEGEARRAIVARVRTQLGERDNIEAGLAGAAKGPSTIGAGGVAAGKDDKQPQALFDALSTSDYNAPFAGQAKTSPADTDEPQASQGRLDDLELDQRYLERSMAAEKKNVAAAPAPQRQKRKEQVAVIAETLEEEAVSAPALGALNVSIFESEVEPFDFAQLDDNHFVLFRWVSRNGERLVQGALIDRETFLRGLIGAAFEATNLSRSTDLLVGYRGSVLDVFGTGVEKTYLASHDLDGALLHRTRLPAPLDDVELVFNIRELPAGPGLQIIIWAAVVLAIVFFVGFFTLYRLGLRQIQLGRQQQDFVAAVSHELKTPLTSIRMYAEMLQAGWVDEEKRKTYYDFICAESERLSRLIANVLELARLTNSDLQLDLKPTAVGELVDLLSSKIGSQVSHAGFELSLTDETTADSLVTVDVDAFVQIAINLVDNAIKFSRDAAAKRVEITLRDGDAGHVVFAVRDFGPGIPTDQMKKIFDLFYRTENELTRETVGTGIGLALVNQLTRAMGGSVDVWNPDPGAEFRVTLAGV